MIQKCEGKTVTLHQICKEVGPEGGAVITLILSLPFLIFVPLPGLSTVLGAIILFAGYRMARKKQLWLPQKYGHKEISGDKFAADVRKAYRFLRWMEKITKKRGPFSESLNGWGISICGFFLILPLPPGTNFLPGLATILLSIGLLEEDFLFTCLGYAVLLANAALLILVPLLLVQEIKAS